MRTADDRRETVGSIVVLMLWGAILYALYIGTP